MRQRRVFTVFISADGPKQAVKAAHRLGAHWRRAGGARYTVGQPYTAHAGNIAIYVDLYGTADVAAGYDIPREI